MSTGPTLSLEMEGIGESSAEKLAGVLLTRTPAFNNFLQILRPPDSRMALQLSDST